MVLSLSFVAAALHAVIQFTYDVFNVPVDTPVTVQYVPPRFDAYRFASQIVGQLFQLAPVALVAHLLTRTGESLRHIGFDAARVRPDVALGVGLAVLAHVAATGATVAAKALDLPFRPVQGFNPDANASAVVLAVLIALVAGISEETILTGYLLTRLQDAGWAFWRAAGASSLLRATFHLYQGVGGFVFNIVGGLAAAAVFRRTGRIVPVVVAHISFDLIAFVASALFPDLVAELR